MLLILHGEGARGKRGQGGKEDSSFSDEDDESSLSLDIPRDSVTRWKKKSIALIFTLQAYRNC